MKRYLLIVKRQVGFSHTKSKVVKAETIEEATKIMDNWCNDMIKKNPKTSLKDKKIIEINTHSDIKVMDKVISSFVEDNYGIDKGEYVRNWRKNTFDDDFEEITKIYQYVLMNIGV